MTVMCSVSGSTKDTDHGGSSGSAPAGDGKMGKEQATASEALERPGLSTSRPGLSDPQQSLSASQPGLSTSRLVQLAAVSAVLIASKELMNKLPNIHPVALILILCTRVYGWQSMYVAVVFILSQAMLHGFGIWFLSYIYVWPLLVTLTMLLRRNEGTLFWALFSGIFGLSFGALCALPYLFAGGVGAAIAYWTAGIIPFDLLHGAGNFAVALIAMKPLERLLTRLSRM